ncbi:MAG: class I SAM-dependent methyltransferase [Calditrichaeota bacterium]|nr:MAG: class I SAM-dependent methyltransferase [Calditrichota bacterium]
MPYAFHSDPRQKWQHQYLTAKHHIISFVEQVHPLPDGATVLEVGCGEGGVLKAFVERGCKCHGIDLAEGRIRNAAKLLAEEVERGEIRFYCGDVHDTEIFAHLEGAVDLIVLKDAIEHIPEKERILRALQRFVKPDGAMFLGFPPWWNPFGGHQQVCRSVLRYVPWFHILPKPLYRAILRAFGESAASIAALMEIYDTRISTGRFERLVRKTGWRVRKRLFFLFNPAYQFKFGIKPRKQLPFLAAIPVLRDFVSTAVYYLLER